MGFNMFPDGHLDYAEAKMDSGRTASDPARHCVDHRPAPGRQGERLMPSDKELQAAARAEVAGLAAEEFVAAGLRALHPSITADEAIDAAHHLLRCALAAA